MLNINTVINSEYFKSVFDENMVHDLTKDLPFPYALIKAYLKHTTSPTDIRRDKVTVEICRWAEDMGVLHRADFDVAYVWHALHADFAESDD